MVIYNTTQRNTTKHNTTQYNIAEYNIFSNKSVTYKKDKWNR